MTNQVANTVMIPREEFDRLNNRHMSGSDLREMLRSMQSGEMTVSRGVELVDMWLAGNYSDEQLPPARLGLGDDEMPWDRIDALTQQRDDLLAALEALHDVVIAQNRAGAAWGERFGKLMTALGMTQSALARVKP